MNTHSVTRNGATVEIDVDALSPDMIAAIIRHGLTQKIGDAAAGSAKIAAETGGNAKEIAESLMTKVRDALLRGDWGVIRAASGVSPETAVWRSVARSALREVWGKDSPKWAEFTGQSDLEQNEFLDRAAEKNREKLQPRFDAEMKRREILAKAKAKKPEIDLDF